MSRACSLSQRSSSTRVCARCDAALRRDIRVPSRLSVVVCICKFPWRVRSANRRAILFGHEPRFDFRLGMLVWGAKPGGNCDESRSAALTNIYKGFGSEGFTR
jgi:hypothetical protein